MESFNFAGIDIGSNAIRLLIKNAVPGESYNDAVLNKLVYLRLPMRLGGDVFVNGKITEQKAQEFYSGLKIYKSLLDYYKIKDSHFRACATSATRSATNGKQVIEKIEKELGIKIDIIDGLEESQLLFKTNIYNLPDGDTFLSADLGGGSFQITIFKDKKIVWTYSFDIGTVRILNDSVDASEYIAFEDKMKEISAKYNDLILIGSGGNINKISKVVGNKTIEKENLVLLYEEMKNLSLDERIKKYSFRKDRADVIVSAEYLYINLMTILNINKIYVPKIGLADGIIRQLYEQNVEHK
ncbi:MAG: hypothetical protein U9Q83_02160 [Bacteroidota bacterium]|nr:hypothetical protein [Bacteroidota bacterium]